MNEIEKTVPLKAAILALGCKVNYFEGAALREKFRDEGFVVVPETETADVYVINACSVTRQAVRKCRQLIHRLKKLNPQSMIVMTGCYPQTEPEEASSLPDVDLITGTAERLLLPGLVREKAAGGTGGKTGKNKVRLYSAEREEIFEEMPWTPEQGRTRAFLKIQDGCRQFCTYCSIPLARGPLRSLPPERGLHYLRKIGESGFKEVVLTGIHLGQYGVDLSSSTDLSAFLEMATTVKGIERIRLSSLEPTDLHEGLIRVIRSNDKICRHLHIPLQSGDDTILMAMGRPYDTDYYYNLLQRLHGEISDLAVSTDIMTGFPGESEDNFLRSLDFVREAGFSRLHVFKFSPRKGTPAADMPQQIPQPVKEKRSKEMISLGEKLAGVFREKHLGRISSVLLEKEIETDIAASEAHDEERVIWEGLTSNYLRVRVKLKAGDWRGKMINVLPEISGDGFLCGKFVPDNQRQA